MNASVQFLRRSTEVRYARLAGWHIDVPANRVQRDEVEIRLTPKAMAVLRELIQRQGVVVRRDDLLGIVWRDGFPTDDVLTHAITELRRALEEDPKSPRLIETIPKVGYRLVATVEILPHASDAGDTPIAEPAASREIEPMRRAQRPYLLVATVAVLTLLTLAFPAVRGRLDRNAIAPMSADTLTRRETMNTLALTADPTRDEFPNLSPDGGTVAYVAGVDAPEPRSQIYLKSVDPAAVPVPLLRDIDGNDLYPVWSPDGKQIAFLHMQDGGCSIRVVPALGGQARSVGECSTVNIDYIDWSADGRSLLVTRRDASPEAPTPQAMIARLNLASGEVERIDYTPVPRGRDDLQPKSSPDGRWIAFRRGALPYSDLYVMAAEGGEARRLTTLHSKLRGFAWMPDSERLVFSSDHEGSQQLFLLGINDGGVVALGGDDAEFPAVARHAPVLVYQQTRALTHLAEFAINANGDLRDPRYIAPSTRSDLMPSLSATGRYLAFVSNRTGSWEVWIHDYRLASTFPATRLNRDELTSPEWSPDERRIVFVARDGGRSELVQVDIDSGRVETLSTRNERVRFGSFSQDGRWIYFSTDRSGDWQVWRMRADRSEAEQLTREGGFDPRDYGDADGVYYAKETSRGLFRFDLATRAEQRVSWQANYFNMDTAYVRDGKLFYIDGYDENGRASLVSTPLAFDGDLSKVENSIETLGSFAATGLLPDASLAPDLMRIVVTQVQRDDTDLMTATLDDVPTRR